VERVGRAEQHAQIHVIVRAAASAVDQSRFGCEFRLLEQDMHRQVGN